MKDLIEWHKGCIKYIQIKTNCSDYQLMWFAFFKGLFLGWIF